MVRSPRATLAQAIANPRSMDLALVIVGISAACSVGFLLTRVGQLAALDQQVRQLESFGVVVDDQAYEGLRRLASYRPALSAAAIVVGWPILWIVVAGILLLAGNRYLGRTSGHPDRPARGTFAQVLSIVVHASAVFAVRAVVAAPVNYARESLGGATSASMVLPAFGESTFPARLFGAVDLFVVWWVVLVAMGLGLLYRTPTGPIARWLFGAYAAGAVALAITQALRGGI